jgi:hypothetical protein
VRNKTSTVGYERRADIHEVFLQLGCTLIGRRLIHLEGFFRRPEKIGGWLGLIPRFPDELGQETGPNRGQRGG